MKIKNYLLIAVVLFSQSLLAQETKVKVSGKIVDNSSQEDLSYVNVVLKTAKDSIFVTGAITDESGLFTLVDVAPGD